MSSDTKQLLEQALRLPRSERLRLAESLLATFDGNPDPDAAEAWEEEIARRSRDIGEGLVEPIPWSKVKGATVNALRQTIYRIRGDVLDALIRAQERHRDREHDSEAGESHRS